MLTGARPRRGRHASAWDLDQAGDVRIKMGIKPNEKAWRRSRTRWGTSIISLHLQPATELSQNGAQDGFHEGHRRHHHAVESRRSIADDRLVKDVKEDQKALDQCADEARPGQDRLPAVRKLSTSGAKGSPAETSRSTFTTGLVDAARDSTRASRRSWRARGGFRSGRKYHVKGNTPYTRLKTSCLRHPVTSSRRRCATRPASPGQLTSATSTTAGSGQESSGHDQHGRLQARRKRMKALDRGGQEE